MIHFKTLLLFLFLSLTVSAQKITINVDLESASAIARLLSGKTVTEQQLTETANLYGNQQLIQKVKGYSGVDISVFKSTLKEAIETGSVKGNDPYNWNKAKAVLPELHELLKTISQNPSAFSEDVARLIEPYTPDSLQLNARACFLIGGGSLGFTQGDDPTFNVALQNIGDDLDGLKVLIAHELYHSVQSAGYPLRKRIITGDKPTYNEKATYAILYDLWTEGSASFVGDFSKVNSTKPFSQTQKANEKKNSDRIRTSFYLLETVLYKAYNDPKVSYSQLYNIGYTTEFDEVFYGVGYEIAKQLVAHNGPEVLATLTVSDPLGFIQQYIQLYQSQEDSKLVKFSSGTEELVEKMMKWVDRI